MRYTDDEAKIEMVAWNAAREIALVESSVTSARRLDIATLEFTAALLQQFGRDHAQQIASDLRNAATAVERWSGGL